MSTASNGADALEIGRRAWVAAIAASAIAVGILGIFFWHEAADVYRVWENSTTYNHCFLIMPLVAYLIWHRRHAVMASIPSPQIWSLGAIPILSAIWLFMTVLGIHEAQQLVVLTILQAVLLSVLGWRSYLSLLGPLLYLYFLVPAGEFIVPLLQDFTAVFVVGGLKLVGVPVFSDGTFIEIPAGKFVIAEACAGLRFLIASIAFGVFFALISYESWIRRALFISLSLVIPLLANGVRVFGIIYAAQLIDSAAAATADHVIYGWGFFSVILVLLVLLGRAFADGNDKTSARSLISPRVVVPARCFFIGVVSAGLAGIGPIYAEYLDRQPPEELIAEARSPDVTLPWQRVIKLESDWAPTILGADQSFLEVFSDGNTRVERFVALYVARGRVNNLVRSQNRLADETNWRIARTETRMTRMFGEDRSVSVSEVVSSGKRKLVVSFYAIDGFVTAGALGAKLDQARDLLKPGKHVSAFVAIATDISGDEQSPIDAIMRFIAAMEPLPAYLSAQSR